MLITISRQFAAGSSVVAERIARALGWRIVDNEFVFEVARRAGVPPEEVARLEERAPSFIERLARLAAAEVPDLFVSTGGVVEDFEEAKLVRITRALVTEFAAEGRAVVVGRAAAAVLADAPNALHVRLVAPRDFRLREAVERLGIDAAEAAEHVDRIDRNRARYHREFYDRDWNDPLSYDLVLNTGRLGFEGAADIVVARARALGWG